MTAWHDEDGIDGPWERALEAAMREDAERAESVRIMSYTLRRVVRTDDGCEVWLSPATGQASQAVLRSLPSERDPGRRWIAEIVRLPSERVVTCAVAPTRDLAIRRVERLFRSQLGIAAGRTEARS